MIERAFLKANSEPVGGWNFVIDYETGDVIPIGTNHTSLSPIHVIHPFVLDCNKKTKASDSVFSRLVKFTSCVRDAFQKRVHGSGWSCAVGIGNTIRTSSGGYSAELDFKHLVVSVHK